MTKSADLWRWQAVELTAAIRSREISAHEVAMSCLARHDAINSVVNAVVELRPEEALAAAHAADAAVKNGSALGILHGVPVTTKLNVDQAGSATSNGVVALQENIAAEDCAAVANLRREGAVILGRTNVPAFSWRWFTDNALHGRTYNPWRKECSCGGSSGGAAVAVATGIGPLSQGSDLAGSIRYPAYACGVVGMRPTFGRVPEYNASLAVERTLLSQLFLTQGPLARSVADIKLGLQAMAQPDLRDPWSLPIPLDLTPSQPCRVALWKGPADTVVDEAVTRALTDAANALIDAGYTVDEVEPPHLAEIGDLYFGVVTEARVNNFFQRIEDLGDVSIRRAAGSLDAIAPHHDLSAYVRLLSRRTTMMRDWQLFLKTHPLLLMPVSLRKPFLDDQDLQGDAAFSQILRDLAPTIAINILGFPALAVPTGLIDGLPTGVQLVASRFDEARCLSAGSEIERRRPILTPLDPLCNGRTSE
jgi:amidase